MTETEKQNRLKLAAARALGELREASKETGIDFQAWVDSEGNNVFNFFEKEEHRMPTPHEMLADMRDFVARVESAGQIKKPVQLQFTNKFKRFLTKFRG